MVTEEERKLVLARLINLPSNMKLSVGSNKPLSKDELIGSIRKGEPAGDKFVEMQLAYLRNIAKEYA